MRLLYIVIALGLGACNGPVSPEAGSYSAVNPLLKPVFDAHGGLDIWRSFRSLAFTLTTGSSSEDFIVDLNNRYERIKGSNYEIGYNGDEYWQWLKDTSVTEKNPKFAINLQFYFFAMPFVLADPGVNSEDLGERTLNDKPYRVIKITYDAGIGVAPEDQYILYVDPATHRLEYLLYSVTFFNADNAEKYSALHYTEWQQKEGLLLPYKLLRYAWDAEKQQLGQARGEKIFSNVELGKESPPAQVFTKPEGAKATL